MDTPALHASDPEPRISRLACAHLTVASGDVIGPVQITMAWDPHDPYAVVLTIPDVTNGPSRLIYTPIYWTIARDLLVNGGDTGALTVTYAARGVTIRHPQHHLIRELLIDADSVRAFSDTITAVTPLGAEPSSMAHERWAEMLDDILKAGTREF